MLFILEQYLCEDEIGDFDCDELPSSSKLYPPQKKRIHNFFDLHVYMYIQCEPQMFTCKYIFSMNIECLPGPHLQTPWWNKQAG